MKIGIFGGSFNPVHKGHVSVAKEALKVLKLDALYFVPTFRNPFKAGVLVAAPAHRVAMLKLILGPKMHIDEFELSHAAVSYTINTVAHFAKSHPGAELFLLIGSDLLPELHQWKQIDDIAASARIVVFRRDENFNHRNAQRFNCLVLDNDVYPFASSWFRVGKIQNVPPSVLKYIAAHYLYIDEILASMVDEDRLSHCHEVARIAHEIAQSINYDAAAASFAALVHDITKNWTNDEHRAFLRACGANDAVRDYQLHAETAYYWLKDEYLLANEQILNAVRRHTSLGLELTTLDKIVFSADKLDGFLKSARMQEIYTLIKTDFDLGFQLIVRTYYERLILKTRLSPEVEAIYRRWM